MSSEGQQLRPGRTWLSVSGIYLEPDPQRTQKADKGRAFERQSAAVDGVRRKFDVVDARECGCGKRLMSSMSVLWWHFCATTVRSRRWRSDDARLLRT